MGEECAVPQPRGWAPAACAAVLVPLALVLVSLLEFTLIRELSGLYVLSLSLGAVLHYLCLLAEECLFHKHQRYGGRIQQMLWACFSKATLIGVCVAFLILLLGGVSHTPKQWASVVLTSALYLLLKTLGVLGPAPVEISEVCESRKMNVAHGLAWSFYLGYLKLVLPELEQQIRQFCGENREPLSSVRLHILLPLSAAAPNKLEEVDRNVRFHKNLPELQLDRAGIRKRVYKHSIYKITDQNNEDYYCVAEYATPLQTLYQMSQDGSAGFSAWDRRQQVLLFYTSLSHILENSLECRNRYRLILLDDEQAAEPHYLSQEIIKTLQQQKHEIPMDLSCDLPRPVKEEGHLRNHTEEGHLRNHTEEGHLRNHTEEGHLRNHTEEGHCRNHTEEGHCRNHTEEGHCRNHVQEPFSSVSSLMISAPGPLRSMPVENTDYTQNHQNAYR